MKGLIRERGVERLFSISALPDRQISKDMKKLYPPGNCHALPVQPARTRRPCGTWKIPLSAALFPT